jgi:hypothetical protein
MLLYHPISKTYDDFNEVHQYRFDDMNGSLIETDKELIPGSIVVIKGVADYAIIIKMIWEEDGKKYFSHDSAEEIVVRARMPRNRD